MAEVTRFKTRDDDVDLNQILQDSWDFVGTENANKPSNTMNELGFVFTKNVGVYGGSKYYMQWYYGWTSGNNFVRKWHSGVWNPWEKL